MQLVFPYICFLLSFLSLLPFFPFSSFYFFFLPCLFAAKAHDLVVFGDFGNLMLFGFCMFDAGARQLSHSMFISVSSAQICISESIVYMNLIWSSHNRGETLSLGPCSLSSAEPHWMNRVTDA